MRKVRLANPRRRALPPTDQELALQMVHEEAEQNDIDLRKKGTAAHLLASDPTRLAKVCWIAANLSTTRPERKITFLLEGVRWLCETAVSDWRVEFMLSRLAEAKKLLDDETLINKRGDLLRERWCEIGIQVFHAEGSYLRCADIYGARARACANGDATTDTCANLFMAEVERCNFALVQGIPETIQACVRQLKNAAGRLIIACDALKNEQLNVYWRIAAFVYVLRAEWLGSITNAEESACLQKFRGFNKDAHGRLMFTDAIKVITAAYAIRQKNSWGEAMALALTVAQDARVHPDWRADAYFLLALATCQQGFVNAARKHINDLKNLPKSGGHVARALALRFLDTIQH